MENSVRQIFEEAIDMMDKAYMMIITEIADENAEIEDLEFLAPFIAEFKETIMDFELCLYNDISKEWIGDLNEFSN